MEFIASITLDVSYVHKIRRLWKMSGDLRNPLKNVLAACRRSQGLQTETLLM